MTQRPYDSDGDDCARAMSALTARRYGPAITLSGYQAHSIAEAFADAERALREAETSKLPGIRNRAREARARLTTAWAHVKQAMADVKGSARGAEGGSAVRVEGTLALPPAEHRGEAPR